MAKNNINNDSSLIQLIIHAESISWTRFYNFLVSSSIILALWTAIYFKSDCNVIESKLLLRVISFIGIASCLCFSVLSFRGRNYLSMYIDLARYNEGSGSRIWDFDAFKAAGRELGPMTLTDALDKKLIPKKQTKSDFTREVGASRFILTIGPILYLIVFIILLFKSFLII